MLFWQLCFIPRTPLVWMSVWGRELGLEDPPEIEELDEPGRDREP